ncbi:MAG TPA: hypothetical protein VKH82_13260 [Candidatus Binatia bacterium]|nr:hypothetical protein [Candidatus Binatia bacterium]
MRVAPVRQPPIDAFLEPAELGRDALVRALETLRIARGARRRAEERRDEHHGGREEWCPESAVPDTGHAEEPCAPHGKKPR